MKKIYRIITLGVSILVLSLASVQVSAAELKADNNNKTNENGVLKLPLIFKITEEDGSIPDITLSCSVEDSMDVSCSLEHGPTNITSSGTDKKTFKYLDENSQNFPEGDTLVAYLVLTNTTTSQQTVKFSVKSPDGTYQVNSSITVSGLKVKSNDATLKKLTVSQGKITPAFAADTLEYTVYGITDTIKSVNIDTECGTSGCTIDIDAPAGKNGTRVDLDQGSNKIQVKVTSEDGSATKIYTLNILRGDTGYNSSKLSALAFSDYTMTPSFKSDVLEYTVTVPYAVTSLVNIMSFEKIDPNAKESLEGFDNLEVGENKATITVDNVNEDSTTTYVITIVRMNEQDIEVLKYINKRITFRDSDGIQTTLSEEEFMEQYPKEWDRIQDGYYSFDDEGNIITEEEKEENNNEEKKKNNLWIIILIIVIGLIAIGVAGFFIFKRKKTEESEEEVKESTEEEINEENLEEEAIVEEKKNPETETMNIDDALVDLMSTKQYEFKDEE